MPGQSVTKGDLITLLNNAIKDGLSKEVIARLQWFLHYQECGSVRQTCRHFNIARSTFYRWLSRFNAEDLSALEDKPTYQQFSSGSKVEQIKADLLSELNKPYLEQVAAKAADKVRAEPESPFKQEQGVTKAGETKQLQSYNPCFFCRHRRLFNKIWRTSKVAAVLFSFAVNIAVAGILLWSAKAQALNGDAVVLVNTESFSIIQDGNGSSDIYLQFGYDLNEKLNYSISNDRFEFTERLHIAGELSITSQATGTAALMIDAVGTSAAPHIMFGYNGTFDTNLFRETSDMLRTDDSLNVRGDLEVAGTISGAVLTLGGGAYTFPSADGTNGYVLKTDGSGNLTWQDDETAEGGGGITQDQAEAKYVSISGDTMTGALVIDPNADSTAILRVNDADGGAPVFDIDSENEQVGVGTAAPAAKLAVSQAANGTGVLITSDATGYPVLALDGMGKTGAAPHILFGYNGAFDTNLFRETANMLRTDDSLNIRGDLEVAGTISGAVLTLGGGAYTFPSADGTNGYVLKTDGNGNLTWQADATGEGGEGGGLTQTQADEIYVNESGDTMTGTLVINDEQGVGLSVYQNITATGSLTINNDNTGDATLNFGNSGGNKTLIYDSGDGRFEFSGDVHITDELTVSGLTSCSYIITDSNGKLACGTDSFLTSDVTDDLYVKQSGDTMTGALVIDPNADSTAILRVNDADGGAPVFDIDSENERVGVGTGSPAAKLAVSQAANGTGVLITSDATGYPVLALDGMGTSGAAPHILFGYNGSFDTNLFRETANMLRTDDSFNIRGDLEVAGTISGSTLRLSAFSASGTLVYSSGGTLLPTAQGSSGQVLVSQGTAAPAWKNITKSMMWYINTLSVMVNASAIVPIPFDYTITAVDLRIKNAPFGADLIVDILKDGASIFSTKPRITDGNTSGGGSAVFSTTSIPAGSLLTVNIDQVGSANAGSGLTIMINGVQKY